MSSNLPYLPKIAVLSPLVTRILGCNPGNFTLQGTNTYLIGAGKKRVLIDSGDAENEYTSLLADYVRLLGIEISAIFLTHWHHDHVNGVQPLLEHPDLGPRINERAIYKFPLPEDSEKYVWKVQPFIDGQVYQGDGFTLTGYHTPGHAVDHLVFWLEEEKALFSGDNILGHGTAVFEDLKDYMESLHKMSGVISKGFTGKPSNVRTYPGHGQYIQDSHEIIEQYIRHRQERENQIRSVVEDIQSEHENKPVSTHDIVSVIYKDYPESIWPAAQRGIHLHLVKLEREGVVQSLSGDNWKISRL